VSLSDIFAYMIISETTKKAVKQFTEKEWRGVDMEHYGKPTKWTKKGFVFKAENDGRVIGVISGNYDAGVLHIDELIVSGNIRGKGVGKALMKKAEEFGKKEKAHKVHLSTGRGWRAEKFYEQLGYKQIAILPKHHFGVDFVIYEKFFT